MLAGEVRNTCFAVDLPSPDLRAWGTGAGTVEVSDLQWVCRWESREQFSHELGEWLGVGFSFPNGFMAESLPSPPISLALISQQISVSGVIGLNAPAAHCGGCSYAVRALLLKRRLR